VHIYSLNRGRRQEAWRVAMAVEKVPGRREPRVFWKVQGGGSVASEPLI
jgi:hypothetical protein